MQLRLDFNLLCFFHSSKLEQILSAGNSSAALCNFTITEHACSSVRFLFKLQKQNMDFAPLWSWDKSPWALTKWLYSLSIFFFKAPYLTSSNLVTLLNCTLKSQHIYPVEVWKLFFQKASAVLDQALETFANMVSTKSHFLTILPFPCVKFGSSYNYFSANSRAATTPTRPRQMCSRLLEKWELTTSARHNYRVRSSLPAGSRQRSVRFWPFHLSTSYFALAPKTSAARHTRLCK